MEVDWLLLGCRAVASWNMQLGSRRRTLLQRSATRTSWADSYTFAKTERPSLDSVPPAVVVTLAAEWVAAATVASVVIMLLLEVQPEHDRSTSPTFVHPFHCSIVVYIGGLC